MKKNTATEPFFWSFFNTNVIFDFCFKQLRVPMFFPSKLCHFFCYSFCNWQLSSSFKKIPQTLMKFFLVPKKPTFLCSLNSLNKCFCFFMVIRLLGFKRSGRVISLSVCVCSFYFIHLCMINDGSFQSPRKMGWRPYKTYNFAISMFFARSLYQPRQSQFSCPTLTFGLHTQLIRHFLLQFFGLSDACLLLFCSQIWDQKNLCPSLYLTPQLQLTFIHSLPFLMRFNKMKSIRQVPRLFICTIIKNGILDCRKAGAIMFALFVWLAHY